MVSIRGKGQTKKYRAQSQIRLLEGVQNLFRFEFDVTSMQGNHLRYFHQTSY